MELKKYQKRVLYDLNRYLELLNQTKNSALAFKQLWEEKGVPVGFGGMQPYQNILPGVPNLCLKVPTGGGKTFLACNAIKPIFDALPYSKTKAVVWLVPSEAILVQTLAALKNPNHPYRQKIDTDFGGRVEVYTKQELLNAQNFNITAVTEQLSIMVLSYDSFRGRKEALKAKQENSSLAPMAKALGEPENPVEDADETALLQIINQLSPLVVVDESHHARSTLSKNMLRNFNPCFVLDLTATPTRESNIVSFVDAVQLKRENMVKLPVIVYNRNTQQEVIADAIDLRNRLEEQAVEELLVDVDSNSNRHIRPIVLFQAQPKGKEDSTTFKKLRDKLVDAGIPANEIAIKTADVNELKNVDLMSADCDIRYLITVNALKEGWDCPFAYILASLANKTSQIDVEQILGRVLRQPYTKRYNHPSLNMSYVLTSSNDFKTTLDVIVRSLNGAGFSERDCRTAALESQSECQQSNIMNDPDAPYNVSVLPDAVENTETEEFLNFDSSMLEKELLKRKENITQTNLESGVDAILRVAQEENTMFENALNEKSNFFYSEGIPAEVQDKMSQYHMNAEFLNEASQLEFPQFFMKVPESLFSDGYSVLLEKEHLAESFTLKGKPYSIDFACADDEIAKVDISDAEGSIPKVFKMSENDQRFFKEQFSKFTSEQKVRTCKDIIHRQLNKMDMVDAGELKEYIDRIVGDMNKEMLSALEKSPQSFAMKIKQYVEGLLKEHYMTQFTHWLETERIVCAPSYRLPIVISPVNSTNTFGRSLYQAEEEVNGFEYDMVMALTGMQNIKWWHRNISRHGFCINGFIKHYPDFIVMTKRGKIVVIETKGDHLENTESKQKLSLGRAWQKAAGHQFRYYMVFQNKNLELDGAIPFDSFVELMKEL